MIDAHDYEAAEKLKNGTPITIRAIRPDDKERIMAAFNNLDPESIYTRFFSYKRGFTEEELKVVTEVDFENTVALVVTIRPDSGEEIIIGAGRYVLLNPPSDQRSAEIAFTVEEDYQGQGVAGSILRHLIHIAREQGVLRFEADVLAQNGAMLNVLARSGFPMEKSREVDAVHVTLFLTAPAP